MQSEILKPVLKYLVQCEKLAPSLTPIQIGILLVLMHEDRPMDYMEIASELRITRSMTCKNAKFMLAKNGQDIIQRKDYKISLTDKGKLYCNSMVTNTTHFITNELGKST
ncbi:MarR family transcriptional regulator [Endozoicomonas gorgoniicola]|uniref:MarR family transcriptional regulator n=1 Tax=Endozoicomonas gorgoniicola TaxID=1234144 RepID=A0ABT3MQK7_9GAMM|nr:MarR family transcriptional regulator [Endozoicomonas gorgoniicola]MCW7551661.1 MarR family transcriptional regulator [Endozoicomonas gorgoniicola]